MDAVALDQVPGPAARRHTQHPLVHHRGVAAGQWAVDAVDEGLGPVQPGCVPDDLAGRYAVPVHSDGGREQPGRLVLHGDDPPPTIGRGRYAADVPGVERGRERAGLPVIRPVRGQDVVEPLVRIAPADRYAGTLDHHSLRGMAGRCQGVVDAGLHRDHRAAVPTAVLGEEHLGPKARQHLGERMHRPVCRQHRGYGADPGTGEHRGHRLGQRTEVQRDPVADLDTKTS